MTTQTSKQYFNSLAIIHGALIAGQLIFLAVTLKLISDGHPKGSDDIFKFIAPTLAAICLASGLFIKKKMLENVEQKELKDKLGRFRNATIVQCALLEGASLFNIVCILLTGKLYFIVVVLLCIAVQLNERPSKAKAINQLRLNDSDTDLINDPEALVAESTERYRGY